MARPRPTAPSRRRAVFFDLDGTLLESRLSIRDTLNRVLAERSLPPFSRDEMDRLIGTPLRGILAQRTADDTAIEAMTHRYRAAYNETGWVTVDLFPGLRELLADLRHDGIALATVTSKGQLETETLLVDLGLGGAFDAIVGDDDRRPLKPDPAPVLEACRLLQVRPEEAIMVGDTTFDVHAAKAAGVLAVGVLWGIHDRATLVGAGADLLVRDTAALREALDQRLR